MTAPRPPKGHRRPVDDGARSGPGASPDARWHPPEDRNGLATGMVTSRTTAALLAAAGAHLVMAATNPDEGSAIAHPVTYTQAIAASDGETDLTADDTEPTP
jgi:hypothetical protein